MALGVYCGTQSGTLGATADKDISKPSSGQRAAHLGIKNRQRPWDSKFLTSLRESRVGGSLRFELVDGEWVSGRIHRLEHRAGVVVRVDGQLTSPGRGRFFFQEQSISGKAGSYVGLVEMPSRGKAYRIEPSATLGQSDLVERALDEAVCLRFPSLLPARGTTNVAEIPPLDPSAYPVVPIPEYQVGIIPLESLPGSKAVLYLDYRGGYTPTWGGITYAKPNASNGEIRDVWKRVAEDYLPFNINVTTDSRVFQNAAEGNRQRVVVTSTTTAAPGAGGVAMIGSFNWSGDTPCWVFNVVGKPAAEAISHELGHALGLSHDGMDVGGGHTEYYEGQGIGAVGWAPIMGVGYDKNVSQWSKGEYDNANNDQDDLAIITSENGGVDYRVDDTGDTLSTARYLEIFANRTAKGEGVIERTGDSDAFRFTTTGGSVNLRVDPVGDWGDLAIQASLYDSKDNLVYTSNPQTTLFVTVVKTITAGSYTLQVKGAGRRNAATDGFSSYGSLGYYKISGSITGGKAATRFSIPENSPDSTVVGVVPIDNSTGSSLVYRIEAGNIGGAFSIDNLGQLVVLNSTALDYERLALPSQFPIQFELFVSITDGSNNVILESDRRVVVTITDVNEAPIIAGFSTSVFEHTQKDILLGRVTATDPDFRNSLVFSIQSGDTNGLFSIGKQSGEIRVVGDLKVSEQNNYVLAVRVSDQTLPVALMSTSIVNVAVLPNAGPFRPGTLNYAVYTNIIGTAVVELIRSTRVFPYDPAYEKPVFSSDGESDFGDNYGGVMRGYLIPPATGSYRFWIATDDSGELLMSTSTNTANTTRIATVNEAVGVREWTRFASQQSGLRSLVAGQAYYIEARMKESGGNDHIAVAWECLSAGIERGVIPGLYLAPIALNYTPRTDGFTTALHRDAIHGSRVGVVNATDVNTNDVLNFTLISGNNDGLFDLNPSNGIVRLVDEAALPTTPQTLFSLQIRVADNGIPSRSRLTTNTIRLFAADIITTATLRQEIWTNIGSGSAVVDLTKLGKYPKRPDLLREIESFQSGEDVGESYGSRIRAFLTPPVTSSYNFYIASSDGSSLRYGPATNTATATAIASISSETDYQDWFMFSSQKSANISLTAGRTVYLDVIHKTGLGHDHVSVGWTGGKILTPTVIDQSFLTPIDLNYAPELRDKTAQLLDTATNGTVVTTLLARDSAADPIAYKITEGNLNGAFVIDIETGVIRVADAQQLVTQDPPIFSLTVRAQDSGFGDLYPRKSTDVTVQIQLVKPATSVWSGNGGAFWSDGMSWTGTLPVDGASLVFEGLKHQTNTNNSLKLVGPVVINQGGFHLSGQALDLRAGLKSVGDNAWDIPSRLLKDQAFTNESGKLSWNGSIELGVYSLAFHVNESADVSGAITGTGGLTKVGVGKLTLSASNSFRGPTTISGGMLRLINRHALAESPHIEVQTGAVFDVRAVPEGFAVTAEQTLSGDGNVVGDVTILGTVSPGVALGRLNFSDNLTLAGVTFIEVNRNGGQFLCDEIEVTGTMQLGGRLVVTNLGAALVVGDRFKPLFAARLSGAFDVSLLGSPGEGLAWDTHDLATTGVLTVQAGGSILIDPPVINGALLELRISSVTGNIYILERSPRITSPMSWVPVSTNLGTGEVLLIQTPFETEAIQQFYRLRTR